jgi:hypothetical protein
MTTNPRVQNETVTCGTFGTGNVGTAADRPVELEIVIPPVNPPPRVIQVTFVRNGPC